MGTSPGRRAWQPAPVLPGESLWIEESGGRGRWRRRRTCTHLLLQELQNYNFLLNNSQQENVGSHQKRYPTSKGKGEAQQDSRGAKSYLDSNPNQAETHRWHKQSLYAPETREATETEPDLCLNVSCRSTGQQWPAAAVRALGAADLGTAQALLEEVAINPTIELPELTQDWGN